MEQINDSFALLDLMARPAFCVKDGTVLRANREAQKRNLKEGMSVNDILLTGSSEYNQFQSGCLYLTLQIAGIPCGASVTRMDNFDVFLLEQDEDLEQLQTMALAAQELRQPLTNVMTTADHLFPLSCEDADTSMQDQIARINRGLFQMQRIISNMSDAYRYCQDIVTRQEVRDVCSIMREIFLSAAPLVEHVGMHLDYLGPEESICCLVDYEKLERAVNNILSNALKFTPVGGTIEARLTRSGNMLYLTVQDSGAGIPDGIRSSIYSRYRRAPGIEDSRFGIGLGMVLIRSAAAAHGGTVLMEQSEERGNRLTMTLSIRQTSENILRSGSTFLIDYAGGRNHRLLELSESLPAELYQKENWN